MPPMRSLLVAGGWISAQAALGCADSARPAQGKEITVSQDTALVAELEWSMSAERDPARLRITYTVHNRSAERLYLCDQLAVVENNRFVAAPKAVIVMNGGERGLVRFIRGEAPLDKPTTLQIPPGARAVEPGEHAGGEAEVPLPLKAWHNYGFLAPLTGTPESATLEIAYATGEGSWGRLPLAEGGELTVPQPATRLRYLVSDVRPVPRP
jgi:hypothetical protein